MDDDYDMDEFGDELDEVDDFSLDDDDDDYSSDDMDEDDEDGSDGALSDAEIEIQGSMDGESDAFSGSPIYSNYGGSMTLDDLTDEQRDIYDTAYHSSYEMNR